MMRVYSCLTTQHHPELLLLVAALCLFACLTSLMLAQRGRAAAPERRIRWLLPAGLVTGISIWVVHFAAMLVYRPDVEILFDVRMAVLSILLACGVATGGWLAAFRGAVERPVAGGLLIGAALALAHFCDIAALRVAGDVSYDADLMVASIVAGLVLCAVAVRLLAARSDIQPPLGPAFVFACGILVLHFVAISGVSIMPTDADPTEGLALEMSGIPALVIASAILVLSIGLGIGYHDRRIAELTGRDAERLKELVAALQRSEEHHRYSVALNPQIPWLAEPDGTISEGSPRWAEVVGVPVAEALGEGWVQSVHPEDRAAAAGTWRQVVAARGVLPLDIRYRLKQRDGSYRWVRARAQARRDAHGAVVKWYGTLEDIHEKVLAETALRASEERYRLASRATKDIIWDWSHETDQVQWGDAIETVLGYPEAKSGTSLQWWVELLHPEDRDRLVAQVKEVLEGTGTSWLAEYRIRAADGTWLHMLSRGQMIRAAEGRPVRTVGALLDITTIKRVEEDLRRAAHHDPLTGLPNRALFAERLEAAFTEAGAAGRCVGLITLDVDGFKAMNDGLGHAAGDAVLRAVGERLCRNAPPGATVARLGGDEFAVILPGLQPEDARIETVERILEGVGAPLALHGRSVAPSLSAGAAMWPRDGTDAEELRRSADLALYAAKAAGPGSIRGFRPAMRQEAERRATMLREARQALADDRVVPHYQPKICLRTGALVGLEALLRWQHRDHGVMPPGAVSAAFEDAELSVQLTDRMLERVLADLVRWLDKGFDPGRVAINGAAGDFARGDFAERILSRLHAAGIDPSRLELEVTETVFLGRLALPVERALQTLSAAGVTIALDDFGTGHASLTHLRQLPVHTIKIDRTFVARMPSEPSDAAIVAAVIGLARRLGKTTVAEGVETELQARLLAEQGCDIGQGYLFGRAVEAACIEQAAGARPFRRAGGLA
ncbi:EAL domain-containing protein [Siccirubricoccus sp. KC 17139]|uniref:EAL domain-containing protein n=1 Tax=Siccirubricoccus soli TaxID=2899147 RepID=A0ABT1DDU2_9PROT|nr:EAL domain-containing protein [Siccirubricoccus soli]MCO6419792.1 EAL domain-containing protein [Siccirubricoccus soli]MCP2685927.1 EAL domain-containing protein [Siccirubricoccus soli]